MDFVWISLGILLSPSLSHFNPTLPNMNAPTTHTLSLSQREQDTVTNLT